MSDREIKRLARELANIKREVVSRRSPQADYTSIENGGNFTFKDGDGNVTAVVGGQDDGSNTIRHVDGPTPPIPSGLTAHVDGPIIQVSWDGTFETDVTHDWHYLEVLAVGPNNEQLTGTINDLSGGSTSLAATVQGEWFITARSVSRAGKRSLDGDAGTASVQLVGLTGAIDAVQESANGKNTIYYSPTEPTPPELGFNNGDLWFDTSEEGANTASVWDGSAWVSMADARLATIIAAQEALESDLQDVQTSVDGKNTITWNPSAPSAVSNPGKAVGDLWYRTSGNSIVGFWKWDGTDWVTQLLDVTTIPLIDIGAGTFGSLAGSRLAAKSVTTDQLLVGKGSNLIPWSTDTISPHSATGQQVAAAVTNPTIGKAISITGGTGTSEGGMQFKYSPTAQYLPTTPGTLYRFRIKLASTGTLPAGTVWRLQAFWYNESGTYIGSTSQAFSSLPGLTVTEYAFTPNPNPNAYFVAPHLRIVGNFGDAQILIKEVGFEEQVGATLIQNGGITTPKLAVGAITAESGIIESLDLGTATVGELDGIRIMGQTVRGEQLSGDAIDGKVITGGTYRTTGGTGSWSDDGLFIAQPDGTSMVRFPTDGSPLSLTASDVQIDRASITDLDLSYGAVRSGGALTLASGVTAPASPPELTTGWQKVCTLDKPEGYPPHAWGSLAYWSNTNGASWVRTINIFGAESSDPDRIALYDADTGVFERAFTIGLNPTQGVTVMGDTVYLMGDVYSSSGKKSVWIHGYDLVSGAKVSEHEYTRTIQAKNALGNDGTNLIVASVYNLELWVHRRDPVTGVQVGSDMRSGSNSWPESGNKELYGVSIDGSEVTVVPSSTARVYTVSGGVLTRKTDSANTSGFAGWDNPNRNGAGAAWQLGVPFVVDGTGGVYQGAASFPSDHTLQACFTWWDGTNETTPSPVATIVSPARSAYTISAPERSGLQRRLYVRSGTTGSWWRFTMPAGTVIGPLGVIGTQNQSLPATNSFPASTPAVLKSNVGGFEVKGDGSGHWGPLTFNADGSMTSSAIPAWVPVTSFASGFGPRSWGFAPAYRVWPDGKVEWRGIVTGAAMANGQVDPFTIPAEARPLQHVQFAAASTSGVNLKRVEFRNPTDTDPNVFRVFHGGVSGDWVSLDGIFYYLT